MIVDPRAGSQDYIAPLRAAGVPVEVSQLDSGDIELLGRGPDGQILIGVEIKRVGDLLSCIRDGRAAEQLRGMRRAYAISWLLVEGFIAPGAKDELYVQGGFGAHPAHGGFKYQEVAGWLLTMTQAAGVLLMRTADTSESVAWLRTLHLWWSTQEYSSHRSHMAMYRPPLPMDGLLEPTLVQRVAAALPGIGITRSLAVAERFQTVEEMVQAGQDDWEKIEGIGKSTALKVVGALRHGSR